MSKPAKPRTFTRSESWYLSDAPDLLVDVIAELTEYLDRAGPLYRDKVRFEIENDYYSGHASFATISYDYTETQAEAEARSAAELEQKETDRMEAEARKRRAQLNELATYRRLKAKYDCAQ